MRRHASSPIAMSFATRRARRRCSTTSRAKPRPPGWNPIACARYGTNWSSSRSPMRWSAGTGSARTRPDASASVGAVAGGLLRIRDGVAGFGFGGLNGTADAFRYVAAGHFDLLADLLGLGRFCRLGLLVARRFDDGGVRRGGRQGKREQKSEHANQTPGGFCLAARCFSAKKNGAPRHVAITAAYRGRGVLPRAVMMPCI